MPNQPKTPKRGMRISDEEWEEWKAFAEESGYPNLTAFVRETVNNRIRRARNRSQT